MKTIRFFLLWCMVVAISACTPFYRGFEGSTLVSPARPDVSVSVVDMPMLAHGQIAPFLNTDQGYQFPETLVSVYGTDAASPVAIVALSFVPSNAWEWDPLSFSGPMAQQNMGTVFGGESFYGSVRIVNGAKDPFAPLFAPEDQWASLDWLEAVQAFRERAAKVFHVQYGEAPMPKDEAPYIKTLNARYMGNFLGSMSVKEPLFPNYSD